MSCAKGGGEIDSGYSLRAPLPAIGRPFVLGAFARAGNNANVLAAGWSQHEAFAGGDIYARQSGRTRHSEPGADDAFVAAASTCATASRTEADTLHYEIWREAAGERRVVFNELYVDDAAVEQHMASDHFKAFGHAAGDLWAAPPTIIVSHPVDAGSTQTSALWAGTRARAAVTQDQTFTAAISARSSGHLFICPM